MFLFAATLQVVGAPTTFTRTVPSGPPACGQLSSFVTDQVDASVPLPSSAGVDASAALLPEPPEMSPELTPEALPALTPEPLAELMPEALPEPSPDDTPEVPPVAPLDPFVASGWSPAGGGVLDPLLQPAAASRADASSPGRRGLSGFERRALG